MALINCPECGKQISSNAGQCINCGCKITYCPECKTATAGTVAQCPVCGYKFAGKISHVVREEIDGELSETANYDLFKSWQKSMPNDKTILTGLKYISIILNVISAVMVGIALILVLSWRNTSDPLEKIAGAKELKSGMQALISIACILEIINNIFDYSRESFVKIRCGNWLKKQKIDSVAYLNETIKNRNEEYVKSKDIDELVLFTESAFIAENPSMKSSIYAGVVIRLLCATVLMVCVGVCIMQNVEEFIRVELYADKFNFKYACLIVAAVAGVIRFVLPILTAMPYFKKYDAWKEKNLTELKEVEE